MKKLLFCVLATVSSVSYSQTDSMARAQPPAFAFRLRTIAIEASTMVFYYGGYGGIIDLDFLELPSESVQRLGFRFNYQEYRRGFFLKPFDIGPAEVFERGIYLRASFKDSNIRTDALIGTNTTDPAGNNPKYQVAFGIDIHALVIKPIGAMFARVLGGPNGPVAQIGVTVGYID